MPDAIYIGLGANLGAREDSLRGAIERIAALSIGPVRASAIYEAHALTAGQPDYLNAVARIDTGHEPHALLRQLLRIEHDFGRVRRERWAARTLDLDLLLVVRGGVSLAIDSPGLVVPHPRLRERDFVLAPLCELAPDVEVAPGSTAAAALAALPASRRTIVRRLDAPLVR